MPPQRSPPSTGGTTARTSRPRRTGGRWPQRSPPSTGGTTGNGVGARRAGVRASTEPAQYGRDDAAQWLLNVALDAPQRSPPSTGGTTPPRPGTGSPRSGRLNGARPVRAGRHALQELLGECVAVASTEPAQYGRDDAALWARHRADASSPQRSPPSTGGTTARRRFAGAGYREASTEPAQYGRDDSGCPGGRELPGHRLNGARPVRAGR